MSKTEQKYNLHKQIFISFFFFFNGSSTFLSPSPHPPKKKKKDLFCTKQTKQKSLPT